MTTKRPIRIWAVNSDDPCIARTPEEAMLYFKRRREVAGARLREAAPRLRARLKIMRGEKLDDDDDPSFPLPDMPTPWAWRN